MLIYNKLDFTFMGLPAYNVNISKDNPTISFDMQYTRESMLYIAQLREGHYSNFVVLSPSGVCQFCGSYYSAGTLKCKNCHGYVKDEIASVSQSKFYLLSESTDLFAVGTEMEHFISLDLSINDNALDSLISTLQINKTIGDYLPNSFRLQEEYILCDCCLSIVKASSICPNCGGARLPFSEIIKIDRKCIFCGQKTYEGVMCKSCGASLSGLSYREYQNAKHKSS